MLKTLEHLKAAEDDLARICAEINTTSQEMTVLQQRKRDLERDIANYTPGETVPEKPLEVPEPEPPADLDEKTDHIPGVDEKAGENVD